MVAWEAAAGPTVRRQGSRCARPAGNILSSCGNLIPCVRELELVHGAKQCLSSFSPPFYGEQNDG